MKIAFLTYPGVTWMPASTTFEHLFVALRTLGVDTPSIALMVWQGTSQDDYGPLLPFSTSIIRAKYPSRRSPDIGYSSLRTQVREWINRRVHNRSRVREDEQLQILKAEGVDCAFSVVLEDRVDLSVPLIVWFYDFQHHHLPEMFTVDERQDRDRILKTEAKTAAVVLVKSESVKQDFLQFAPEYKNKVQQLQWVAHIPPSVYDHDPRSVVQEYQLPDKFFYLPNQFWKHKNHQLVLKALQKLSIKGIHPTVVCTGSALDNYHPMYVSELWQDVSRLGLREQFVYLGIVPRDRVFSLMRQSICLLNPTLFEGFGLSVAEAKSLGKRQLLSDLPVLREHDSPSSLYFDPKDPDELANMMESIYSVTPPGPDLELEAAARLALPGRQKAFADGFLKIARQAIEVKSTAVNPTQGK